MNYLLQKPALYLMLTLNRCLKVCLSRTLFLLLLAFITTSCSDNQWQEIEQLMTTKRQISHPQFSVPEHFNFNVQPPIPEPEDFDLSPNQMLAEAFEIALRLEDSSLLSEIAVELAKAGRRKQASLSYTAASKSLIISIHSND